MLGGLPCPPHGLLFLPLPHPRTDRGGEAPSVVEKDVYVHLAWVFAIP